MFLLGALYGTAAMPERYIALTIMTEIISEMAEVMGDVRAPGSKSIGCIGSWGDPQGNGVK